MDDREGCLFTATIRREPVPTAGSAPSLPKGSQKSSQEQEGSQKGSQKSSQKILAQMRANPAITPSELAESLGLTNRAIQKQIEKLKASGQVRRVGPDKGGHWDVER